MTNVKQVQNRPDLLKDEQSGAVMATESAIKQFHKKKQQQQRINMLEEQCQQYHERLAAVEAKLDHVASLLDYIVTGESSDGA